MKAEIKALYSTDIISIEGFHPEQDDEFGFLIRVIIGPQGAVGEESFDVMLCTPRWLIRNYKPEDIVFGRGLLIVFKYDYAKIVEHLHSWVNAVEKDTWDEVAEVLARCSFWEFEDYRD